MRNRKLGVKGFKKDSRTLKLGKYLQALPPAPKSRSWFHGVSSFGEMLNDQLGDCTIAACGHAVQIWSLNASGTEITVPDSEIETIYEKWCGYVPGDPNTDNGGVELDVLGDWLHNGFAGHNLAAYASVNPANLGEVRQAINLFGGVYIGINLPLSAQNQNIWYPVSGPDSVPGSWGGHAVFVPAYGSSGLTAISWGEPLSMTNGFWTEYVEEVYALLSPVFIRSNTEAPSGFNMAALEADLATIT